MTDSYDVKTVEDFDRLYVATARRTAKGRQALIDLGIWTPEHLERYLSQRRADKNHGSQPSRPKNGAFVAWDGEGVTVGGRHRYVMLCNSLGDILIDQRGIATLKALRFISKIASETTECNHVIYGGSYDANMILSDLSRTSMNELATEGYIWIRDDSVVRYRVEYRPRKYLRITRHIGKVKDCTITMYDVIGFFQQSFVKAVHAWLPDVDTTFIEDMKGQRSTFKLHESDTIQRYCIEECGVLVQLMEAVRKNAKELGICPTRWDGAGALAAAMLRRNRVRDYIDTPPPAVNRAAQHAYFGGRIELVRFGHTDNPVYSHDIVSAYPSALRELPCMKHGRWVHDTGGVAHGNFVMMKIHYEAGSINRPFFPFPCRMEDGRVTFPPAVNGWYWRPEVSQALYHIHPDDILSITESWSWIQACNHHPFGFVQRVSDRRLSMKRAGHMGEKVLKLGLNAIYGKLAQKVGAKNGKPPTYHQLEWAGYITSQTRSRIYRLAMKSPESVIAFETDGLYSLADHLPDVDSSDKLGEWDKASHAGITYVQSGIYWLRDYVTAGDLENKPQLVSKPKYRGLDPGTIDEMMVLEAWERGESELKAFSTRFRGLMTSSLSDERYADWCQWITEEKTIQLQPGGKRIHLRQECDVCSKWKEAGPLGYALTEGWRKDQAMHSTMSVGGNAFSCPHKLPWIDGDDYDVVSDPFYLAGQAFDESDEHDFTTWERV